LNKKDWIEELFGHIGNAMECLREFHAKNPNPTRDDRVV
jgi:hypothetical protein